MTGKLLSRDVPTHHIRVIDYSENHPTKGLKERRYEVQAIVNHHVDKDTGEISYLTNWVGYQKSDDTWQKEADFDSKKPIRDYWARLNPTTTPSKSPPNTINKRKLNKRRDQAGLTINRRYISIPNSRIHNRQQQQQQQQQQQ